MSQGRHSPRSPRAALPAPRKTAVRRPRPEDIAAAIERTQPGWLVMWSPWRRKFTAFALFGPLFGEALVLDEAEVPALLDRMREAEMAVERGRPTHRTDLTDRRQQHPRRTVPPNVPLSPPGRPLRGTLSGDDAERAPDFGGKAAAASGWEPAPLRSH